MKITIEHFLCWLEAICRMWLGTTTDEWQITASTRQLTEDAAKCIEVSRLADDSALLRSHQPLFWCRIGIGVGSGVGEAISIAASEVDEFYIMADACDEDIVWL